MYNTNRESSEYYAMTFVKHFVTFVLFTTVFTTCFFCEIVLYL